MSKTVIERTELDGLRLPRRRGANPPADARNLGAGPTEAKGFDFKRSIGGGTSDGVHAGAIDARSLGARPEELKRSSPIRNVVTRTSNRYDPPVSDARSLGARPEESKRSFPSRLDYSSGISLSQSRYPRDGDGDKSHPSTDMGTLQQPSFGGKTRFPPPTDSDLYTGARAEKGSQTYQTHSRRSQFNFQDRAMGGEGRSAQPRRSRPKGPRVARGSDDSEPNRRKRGVEQKSDLDNINHLKEDDWTAEERQYLKEKKERKSEFKVQVYEPENISKEMFGKTAPATASDELGLSNMLGERLLLATKYLDQEFIPWDSKEQKADVMAVVEKLKAVKRGGNPKGNVDQQTQSLMQKLIAGEYAAFRQLGGNDILGHVERHVHRNDSFYPEDEKSLLEKVRSIMPAGLGPKVGGSARNEVKA